MLDVKSIIQDTKKEFTRDRASVINNFLHENSGAVILSYIKKTRGDAVKFYYMQDGKKTTCEYVVKNAKTLLQALEKNGAKLYVHNNGKITEYNNEF